MHTPQEYKTIEYVPVPSSTTSIPANLAPGPNTKVTTTIKTYTYELPGSPETYLPGSSASGNVVLSGDQKITYTLPKSSGTTDQTFTYQTSTENLPGPPIGRSLSPTEITKKSKTFHQESKFYREERHDGSPPYDGSRSYGYRTEPSTDTETRTTVTKQYYQVDDNYPNGHAPDYPGSTVIYQNQTPTVMHTKTINRIEQYGPGRPPSSGYHSTFDKPDTPTRTDYYPGTPQSGTKVYKFSNTTTTVPPNKNADDHEVLLPKPFPTGAETYSSKPIANGDGPPKKLEDLMASFSDSEVK